MSVRLSVKVSASALLKQPLSLLLYHSLSYCITVAKLSFHADLLVFCYIHQTTSRNVAAVVYNGVSDSGRVLLCSWQLLSVVTVATYTGKLTSSSMVIQQPLPFNTLSELVKRTDYRWRIQRKTMVENVLSVRWFIATSCLRVSVYILTTQSRTCIH